MTGVFVTVPAPEEGRPYRLETRAPHVPGEPVPDGWELLGEYADRDVALDEATAAADSSSLRGSLFRVGRMRPDRVVTERMVASSRLGAVVAPDRRAFPDGDQWGTHPWTFTIAATSKGIDRPAFVGACLRAALVLNPGLARRGDAGDTVRAVESFLARRDRVTEGTLRRAAERIASKKALSLHGPLRIEVSIASTLASFALGGTFHGASLAPHYEADKVAASVIVQFFPLPALWCPLADILP